MKGLITTVVVVAVGAAGVWLWNKSHEDSEIKIPEEETLDEMLREETANN